jgi:kexin
VFNYVIEEVFDGDQRSTQHRSPMRLPFPLLFLLLSHHVVHALRPSFETHDYYVLEHDPHVGASLSQVASRLNVQVVERVGELKNLWVVRIPKEPPSISLIERDASEDRVFAALEALHRPLSARDPDRDVARSIADSVKHLSRQELRQRVKRAPPPIHPGDEDDPSYHPLAQPVIEKLGIHDPLFIRQWHLINEENPQHMMNVSRLWDMGITGTGVITALVDDGLDYESEDLADNFVSAVLIVCICPALCLSLRFLPTR